METINHKQLSLIGNMNIEKAFVTICKANDKNPNELYVENGLKIPLVDAPVQKVSAVMNVNLMHIIEDIQNNFTKNEVCFEWAVKEIAKKIVPNKKTKFYPIAIPLPRILLQLLSDSEADKLREMIKLRLGNALTPNPKQPAIIIK